jgi:hypothetical protein
MASIMCGQKLWRAMLVPDSGRTKRAPAVVDQPIFQNVIFGPWAATLARFDGHDLVVALDAAAFLTVVFRIGRRELFRFEFAKALGAALEDLGAPSRTVTLETSVIEFTPLVRLADQTLSRTLDDTKFTDRQHFRGAQRARDGSVGRPLQQAARRVATPVEPSPLLLRCFVSLCQTVASVVAASPVLHG